MRLRERPSMLSHYLLVIGRRLRRELQFSLTNILGLAAGVATTLILVDVVALETSYDADLPAAERTYRIAYETSFGGVEQAYARGPSALLPALESAFPEVEAATVLIGHSDVLVQREGRDLELGQTYYATPSVLEVFPRSIVDGDKKSALSEPGAIVLTLETAQRLFGQADVVGQALQLSNGATYTVTAVLGSAGPTHLGYDALVYAPPGLLSVWNGFVALTYARIRPGVDPDRFEQRVAEYVEANAVNGWGDILDPFLQSVQSIHLGSHLEAEAGRNGTERSVWILGLAAVLTLLMSVSNYVNLTLLRSMHRVGEVGLRKSLGATRGQVVTQFLGESVMLTALAVPIALLVYVVLQPVVAPEVALWERGPRAIVILGVGLLGIVPVVGGLAGVYPAVLLARTGPASALRGGGTSGLRGVGVRRALMGFQFAVTIAFVLTATVVATQMRYIASKDLGYQPSRVLYGTLWSTLSPSEFEGFAREIREIPGVEAVTFGELPGVETGGYFAEDPTGRSLLVHRYVVGEDYEKTLGIKMAKGHPLSPEESGLLLNETAVRHLGLATPLGELLTVDGQTLPVVGVMKDFHFFSLHDPIPPLYAYAPKAAGPYLLVRTNPAQAGIVAQRVADRWDRRGLGTPLDMQSLAAHLGTEYREEVQLGRLLTTFAFLAAVIAYVGLFTLVSYVIARRQKELAIRRVLGAPLSGLVWLIGSEGVLVFLAAAVGAVGCSVVAGRAWLEGFEYRAGIPGDAFLTIIVATLVCNVALSAIHVIREGRNSLAISLADQ